jgi:hypothetical protein
LAALATKVVGDVKQEQEQEQEQAAIEDTAATEDDLFDFEGLDDEEGAEAKGGKGGKATMGAASVQAARFIMHRQEGMRMFLLRLAAHGELSEAEELQKFLRPEVRGTVYSLLFTHYCLLATVYSLLFTHYCLLATVYSLLFTRYCLLATVYSLLLVFTHLPPPFLLHPHSPPPVLISLCASALSCLQVRPQDARRLSQDAGSGGEGQEG